MTHYITAYVNRFYNLLYGLRTVSLRINSSGDAHNIRLKEILKRRALFGNQTVVLLIGSCVLTNSGACVRTSTGCSSSLLFKTSLIPSWLSETRGGAASSNIWNSNDHFFRANLKLTSNE